MSETKQKVSAAPAEESAIKLAGAFFKTERITSSWDDYTQDDRALHDSRINVNIAYPQLENMIGFIQSYCLMEAEDYWELERAIKIAQDLKAVKDEAYRKFRECAKFRREQIKKKEEEKKKVKG